MSARLKNPRTNYPVARLLARIPRSERDLLPDALRAAGPNIHVAYVQIREGMRAMPDRGGWEAIAQLPELAEHYRDGWRYAHAEQIDQGESLEVYLWKDVTP